MCEPCLELVIFKVKDADAARHARRKARDTVQTYDGFLAWTAYEAAEDGNLFADLVLWRDLASAKRAAARLAKDPVFSALLAEIDGLVSFAHYHADWTVEARAQAA
ncbi:hypothetical protein [Roseibium sp. M-1]